MPSAYDVVAHIVNSNPVIEFLTLVTYVEGPNWRDLPEAAKTDITMQANGIQQDVDERIFIRITREEAIAKNLQEFGQKLGSNKLLGVISEVTLFDGRKAHIPMMDFLCPLTGNNMHLLCSLLAELRLGKGYLLETGRSFHYYGLALLTDASWQKFLGKCLLMSGFSDDRYIGHQLVDGHCVLRLSTGKLKATEPSIIAEIS
jgi:hypothetical protein